MEANKCQYILLTCYSKIEGCYFTIKRLVNSGLTQEDAWNQTSVKLAQASEVGIYVNNQCTKYWLLQIKL